MASRRSSSGPEAQAWVSTKQLLPPLPAQESPAAPAASREPRSRGRSSSLGAGSEAAARGSGAAAVRLARQAASIKSSGGAAAEAPGGRSPAPWCAVPTTRGRRQNKAWTVQASSPLAPSGQMLASPSRGESALRRAAARSCPRSLGTSRTPGSFGASSAGSGLREGTCRVPVCRPGWTRGRPLGSGSYGTVYKALDAQGLQVFAVKESPLGEAAGIEALRCELQILQRLRHPHIVSYLGHEVTETHLCIFLEFCAGGSIASMLVEFGPQTGQLLQNATSGALQGLEYLHTRSPPVVHRDVKGANVLLDLKYNVKLADFGCSKCCVDTKSFKTVGSIPWMAPEVIQHQDGHGRKADVWSLGCLVIEMATAERPWGSSMFNNVMFAMNRIANSDLTPPAPDAVSSSCQGFISLCTQREQQLRPSTTELLAHAYIKQKQSPREYDVGQR